jgi:nicotinamide mononucleotide transporter
MFLGTTYYEWAAVITTAACIILAGRNNIHTWWIGILACVLYGKVFFDAKLYADATLQIFFVATGIIGWVAWVKKSRMSIENTGGLLTVGDDQRNGNGELPITKTEPKTLAIMAGIAILVAAGYSYLLNTFTDAWSPGIDSLVLTFSIVGQLLLMRRKIENWPVWLLVNTLSVPLYFYRELYLSAALYAVCWVNAIVAWRHWLDLFDDQEDGKTVPLSEANEAWINKIVNERVQNMKVE